MDWHPITNEYLSLDKKIKSEQGLIRPHISGLKALYRLLDILIVLCSLIISTQVYQVALSPKIQVIGLLSIAIFISIAENFDLYRSWRTSEPSKLHFDTWSTCCVTAAAIFAIAYLLEGSQPANLDVYLLWFAISLFSLTLFRFFTQKSLNFIRRLGYNSRKAAIIGATDTGIQLANNIDSTSQVGIKSIGFFDDRNTNRVNPKFIQTISGNIDDLIELAKNGAVDIIYIALPMCAQDRISNILDKCSNSTVSVHIVPDFFVYNILHARFYSVGSSQTLSIFENPVDGTRVWLKRSEDIVLASLFLFLSFIPMLLIAAAIKLTSTGPVLFKQHRYGLCGKKIEVWKFRTMHTLENGNNITQASRNDSRITPLGRFLRKTSLDELPQFINVLQGSMSIVGPRPHAVAHNEQYRSLIKGYMLRHKVKPGITGWAQINGFRGETETVEKMAKRVEYDLNYIRNWSLRFDIEIVFLTLFCAFSDDNAY